jgi:formylmethanofuran dehydrogenase subunit E
MTCRLATADIEGTVAFHGHWCPGLAIGIRAAEWALSELDARAHDEELVAVVETDMCAVDAIQYLTGCTFGKGNFIFLDYGKTAFTFYRRSDGKAGRLLGRPPGAPRERNAMAALHRKQRLEGLTAREAARLASLRADLAAWIMAAELDALFAYQPAGAPMPRKARILDNRICEACGETVMETRIWPFKGQALCLPCIERRAAADVRDGSLMPP